MTNAKVLGKGWFLSSSTNTYIEWGSATNAIKRGLWIDPNSKANKLAKKWRNKR